MLSQERQVPANYPHPDRERHQRNIHRLGLRRDVDDISHLLFETIDEDPTKIRADLARIWIDYGINDRPSICMTWINSWVEKTLEPVAQANECPVSMGTYRDFFRGMAFITDTIEVGKKEIDGESDGYFENAHQEERAKRTFSIVMREREYARKCAEQLDLDPTGIGVVKWAYDGIRSGRWQDAFSNSEMSMVLKGAGLAKRLYKAIYPLSAGLGKAA